MGRRTGPGVERRCVPQRVGAVVALAGLLWAAGCLGNRRLEAASITVVQGNGNTVFDKSNTANEVDFDIIWSTNLPVQLEVQLDAGDTGPMQGRRPLNRCSNKDFEQVVFVPATASTFHDETVRPGCCFRSDKANRLSQAKFSRNA